MRSGSQPLAAGLCSRESLKSLPLGLQPHCLPLSPPSESSAQQQPRHPGLNFPSYASGSAEAAVHQPSSEPVPVWVSGERGVRKDDVSLGALKVTSQPQAAVGVLRGSEGNRKFLRLRVFPKEYLLEGTGGGQDNKSHLGGGRKRKKAEERTAVWVPVGGAPPCTSPRGCRCLALLLLAFPRLQGGRGGEGNPETHRSEEASSHHPLPQSHNSFYLWMAGAACSADSSKHLSHPHHPAPGLVSLLQGKLLTLF